MCVLLSESVKFHPTYVLPVNTIQTLIWHFVYNEFSVSCEDMKKKIIIYKNVNILTQLGSNIALEGVS